MSTSTNDTSGGSRSIVGAIFGILSIPMFLFGIWLMGRAIGGVPEELGFITFAGGIALVSLSVAAVTNIIPWAERMRETRLPAPVDEP